MLHVENKKSTSSVQNIDGEESSKPFGSRLLVDPDTVFQHNAWDHVDWDDEQQQKAMEIVKTHSQYKIPETECAKYDIEASLFWDRFYRKNENRFFKDRHWLGTEFPELFSWCGRPASGATENVSRNILEVGCGVGNTLFPLVAELNARCSQIDLGESTYNENGHPTQSALTYVYGCDFAVSAIDVLKDHPDYDENKCRAFVYDITSSDLPPHIQQESVDVLLLVFVLSAIHPAKWNQVLSNISKLLKPGGLVLFRDYGRYDLCQLRMKKHRMLGDHFYIRGDHTQVYFFTPDEISSMATSQGFEILNNGVDRRLIVNRSKKLKMYRCWIQSKWVKL